MTECTQAGFEFPAFKRRRVQASFDGGAITSDAGALLLRQVDRQLSLSQAVAGALNDPRRSASCERNALSLVRQRIYALALGYEDLNDHQQLRCRTANGGRTQHGAGQSVTRCAALITTPTVKRPGKCTRC